MEEKKEEKAMGRRTLGALVLTVPIIAGAFAAGCRTQSGLQADWESHLYWHTDPCWWSEPRIYHGPFMQDYAGPCHPATDFAGRIAISRVAPEEKPADRVLSPNGAYWFAMRSPDTTRPGPWETTIDIEYERDTRIRISVRDHKSAGVRPRWINEKLLYVEIWWGRVLGSYLIFDVEAETVLAKEMIHDGGNAFAQHRQAVEAGHPKCPRDSGRRRHE